MEFLSVFLAGATMLGLGMVFAVVLLIASIKLKVEVDPKVEQVMETLPNIDCGACGFAGCASYAKAVVEDPELIGACAPGGSETSEKIALALNLQVSDSGAPSRPIIHCRATGQDKVFYANYDGIPSCTATNAQPNVQACKFGCMGYGDCTRACKFDALHIIDGLAVVDYEKCTGCTACAKTCPRNLIEMVPYTHENMMVVACSSQESGKDTRKMCKVGCIACKLCTKKSDCFTMNGNNARTDYEKYSPNEGTDISIEKCPTGVIVYRGKTAPPPRPAGQKPKPAAAKA